MKINSPVLSSPQTLQLKETPAEIDSLDIALIGGQRYDDSLNEELLSNVDIIRITEGVITESPKKLPQLPFGLSSLSGVAMSDKREIVICGEGRGGVFPFGNGKISKKSFKLNLDKKEWKKYQNMKMPKSGHAMIAHNQCIYVIGGNTTEYQDSAMSSCQKIVDGKFVEIKNLPIGLSECTVSSIDHESFMVIGGCDETGKPTNTTYFYNTVKNDWTPGPSMSEARCYHSSVSLVDDQNESKTKAVVVIGGSGSGRYMKSTEIYNVYDKIWVKGPDLPIEWAHADCVPAPTVSKYACFLVGGYRDGGYSSKVYALSKDLNCWEEIGDFGVGRHGHVALPIS